MADASVEILKRVPLFSGLGLRDIEKVAKAMRPRTFEAGKPALEEGRGGAGFFVVLSGSGSVTVAGSEVNRIAAGDFFGEIALLSEDGLRTATITPDEDLECLGMASWEFKAFLQEHPEVSWTILQTMAKRASA